jgi:hypothetical protein
MKRSFAPALALLSVLVFAGDAWATAYTSTAGGGAWNVETTWGNTLGSGLYPKSGDTATIAAANPVTIPDGFTATVGTSPATGGTVALTISAALTVGGGTSGALVVRGPVQHNLAVVTFAAGSSLTFDASGATTPLSQTYAWLGAQAFSDPVTPPNNRLVMSGTSGSHVAVASNASGGNGYFSVPGGYNDSLWPNCTYVDFTRVGDGVNDAFHLVPASGTVQIVYSHCTFTACGSLNFAHAVAPTAGWTISNCTWSGTVAAARGSSSRPSPLAILAANPSGGPTRLVDACVFDTAPAIVGQGASYTNSVFLDSWDFTPTTSGVPWTVFDSCLVRTSYGVAATGNVVCGGPVTNSYVLADARKSTADYTGAVSSASNPTANTATLAVAGTPWTASSGPGTGYSAVGDSGSNGGKFGWHVIVTSGAGVGQVRSILSNTTSALTLLYNWDTIPTAGDAFSIYDATSNLHMLSPYSGDSSVGNVAFTGNVFESTIADSNGDCLLHLSLASATYTIRHNIVLPNAARDNTGTLFTLGGADPGPHYVSEHNTYFTGAQSAAVSEGADNAAGQITSFRSNLAWCDPARTASYCYSGQGGWSASSLGPYKVDDVKNGNAMPGTATADIITAGFLDYNAGYGLKVGYKLKGYNVNATTTPGAHDVDGDPAFLDRWRNIGSWAVSRGSSGTHVVTKTSDGLTYLKANPALIASSLVPYIRAGFAPGAAGLNNSAHDNVSPSNGTIGAVHYAPSGAALPLLNNQRRRRKSVLAPLQFLRKAG